MNAVSYIKKNGIKRVFDVFYHYKLDLILQKGCNFFLKHRPLQNIIIIESHNDFDSNGGAFYDYLIKNHYNDKYKIVWLLKNKAPKSLPANVDWCRLYKPSLKKALYVCKAKVFTADCVVTNKVRADQKSFYFTHGAVCLKSVIGKCNLSDTVDYILSPSEAYGPIQAKQGGLPFPNDRFVYLGYPSYDRLFTPSEHELAKVTKESYRKVVIWMPTFRKGGGYKRNDSTKEQPLGIPIIESEEELKQLNDELVKMDMLLIIKIHPMQDPETIKVHGMSNVCVLTGSTVKNLNVDNYRLLKDSDALLSDYSSIAYDYLMLNRPIGYDFSDLDSYTNGLCVDNPDEYIAGPKIYCYDELLGFLKDVSEEKDSYKKQREELCGRIYKYTDGNNSKRIAEFMKL